MLAGRFLSDRPLTWQTGFHYDAPVWVVLVLAAVDAFGRRPLHRARWARWGPSAVAVLLVGAVVVGPLVAPAVFPLRRLVDGEAFASSPRARDMAAAIAVHTAGGNSGRRLMRMRSAAVVILASARPPEGGQGPLGG